MNIFRRIGGSHEEVDQKGALTGEALVAQGLPPFALLTASGAGYWAQATTAVAAVTSIPTTAGLACLWNGEVGGGKSYVIDRLFANTEGYDAGNNNYFFFWVCIHDERIESAFTADITIRGLRGGDLNYSGKARYDVGLTVTNDGWFSCANSLRTHENQVEGMSNIDYKMEGRIVLPPQTHMSVHIGTNDANTTAQVGMSWYEVQLDL